MRSLALAQAWQSRGGNATFMSACDSPWISERISQSGARFVPVARPYPSTQDLTDTLNLLSKNPRAWLVVDGYHFDSHYQDSIRNAGHRVLLFDDSADAESYSADAIVNQNIGAELLHYACAAGTRLLLGTRYAVLRPEFIPWRGWQRRFTRQATRVLVTLGASDSLNQLARVVQALRMIRGSRLEVTVVGVENLDGVKEFDNSSDNGTARVRLLSKVDNMAELMARSDLAVSAGGSTCWELAFMGLPNVIMVLAQNQLAIAHGLAEAGVSHNLGWYKGVSVEDIAGAVNSLLSDRKRRRGMSEKGRRLVDGLGPERVLKEAEVW